MATSSTATGSDQNSRWYRGVQSEPESSSPHTPGKVDRDLLGLDKEELGLMSRSWTCETLTSFIDEVDKTTRRKLHGETYERTRSLLHTFSDLAGHLGRITKSMPSNSEY